MKRRTQIAVIGASDPTPPQYKMAVEIGRRIAENGWVLLNGGLTGVMEASAKGAKKVGGTVVGILPTASRADANQYTDITLVTDMGHARNVIIVQSADACVAVGGGEGTLSEIAIALKVGKRVIGLDSWDIPGVAKVSSPEEAIAILGEL